MGPPQVLPLGVRVDLGVIVWTLFVLYLKSDNCVQVNIIIK